MNLCCTNPKPLDNLVLFTCTVVAAGHLEVVLLEEALPNLVGLDLGCVSVLHHCLRRLETARPAGSFFSISIACASGNL